jgi:hypothetical protein
MKKECLTTASTSIFSIIFSLDSLKNIMPISSFGELKNNILGKKGQFLCLCLIPILAS